jgi:DNA-binding CsgD family transcriptional regulator
MELGDFVESLYGSENFSSAFQLLEKSVGALGFEGVLYTYIPQAMVDRSIQPVYHVSGEYSPQYLDHYASARFDRYDPLIRAVDSGEDQPISWWGKTCARYMRKEHKSFEVLATSRNYGINNGITLPLMSGSRGISGASFISSEKDRVFNLLLEERLEQLTLRTRLFHSMVTANAQFSSQFIKPLIESLSDTEKRFLTGLAAGKTPAQIAAELNRTEKYLEQVMLKIRRKLSGVALDESPTLNRNQIMYYAGLLNLLEFPDLR